MSTQDTAVRTARASLSRVIEPGDLLGCLTVAELGPETAWDLIRSGGRAPAAQQQRIAEAAELVGLGLRQRSLSHGLERWRTRAPRADGARDLHRIRQLGGGLLIPEDSSWPAQLQDLHPAGPIGLWFRTRTRAEPGHEPMAELAQRMPEAHRGFAVVGAREMTDYGGRIAHELAQDLSGHGVTIISGGAYGIDAAAHRGALRAEQPEETHVAPTIAVLAGGADRLYPAGNEELLRAVTQRGVLLSELPPGSSPTRHRFLHRNRIIAGLSAASVVVEARARSGALSTAHHALSIGRPVGAFPGSVRSAASAGTHRLLRETPAQLVTDPAEVISLIASASAHPTDPRAQQPELPLRTDAENPLDHMSEADRRIYDALPKRGLTTPSRLTDVAGLPIPHILGGLTRLEAKNLARASGGQWGRAA
ncbi:DNA-processing protein DprA [Nesterenkonia populi]